MSYELALKAAGADVKVFKEFGDYQGTWWAKVSYKGELGWVSGNYGSCSGCDAFEAEFFYNYYEGCEEHRYDEQKDCLACQENIKKYQERLTIFGKSYLDDLLMSQEAAEKEASTNLDWDTEAEEVVAFLKTNSLGD